MGKRKTVKKTALFAPKHREIDRATQQKIWRMATTSERIFFGLKNGIIPPSEKREMEKALKMVGLTSLVMLFYLSSFLSIFL